MKITLSNEELKEVVAKYVEETLGVTGEVTVSKDGITVDTCISAVKKVVKEEPKKEEVKATNTTEPEKKEEPKPVDNPILDEPKEEAVSPTDYNPTFLQEDSIANIQTNINNSCSLFSDED